MKIKQSSFEPSPEQKAHSRALILMALHAKGNMNYTQIREWIKKERGVTIECVSRRCLELYELGLAYRLKRKNRVIVYPVE